VKLIILWCLYLKIYYMMASKVNYFILFKSQSELRLFTFYNGEMVNELRGWVFYFQRLVIWKSWIISYPYFHVLISRWITTLRSYAWEWKVLDMAASASQMVSTINKILDLFSTFSDGLTIKIMEGKLKDFDLNVRAQVLNALLQKR